MGELGEELFLKTKSALSKRVLGPHCDRQNPKEELLAAHAAKVFLDTAYIPEYIDEFLRNESLGINASVFNEKMRRYIEAWAGRSDPEERSNQLYYLWKLSGDSEEVIENTKYEFSSSGKWSDERITKFISLLDKEELEILMLEQDRRLFQKETGDKVFWINNAPAPQRILEIFMTHATPSARTYEILSVILELENRMVSSNKPLKISSERSAEILQAACSTKSAQETSEAAWNLLIKGKLLTAPIVNEWVQNFDANDTEMQLEIDRFCKGMKEYQDKTKEKFTIDLSNADPSVKAILAANLADIT